MIWRFEIYNLFREKFKFRGFTKAFKNFAKYIIAFIVANFKYFAKQIIYLKWYMICLCSKSLKFFRTSKHGLNYDYFAKIAHKIAKSKYFPNILNDSDSRINSLPTMYNLLGVTWVIRKLLGGGGDPAPPHPFILQNSVKSDEQILYKFSRFNELSIKRNIFIVPSPWKQCKPLTIQNAHDLDQSLIIWAFLSGLISIYKSCTFTVVF